jgi:hypothetical protein
MAYEQALRYPPSNIDPGDDCIPVTKSDTLNVFGATAKPDVVANGGWAGPYPCGRALVLGTGGTITITTSTGFKRSVTLPAGYNPLRVHQVWNTGAATDISVIPE